MVVGDWIARKANASAEGLNAIPFDPPAPEQ